MRIVNLSMFKSGTHLIREIIWQLTGLEYVEPQIVPGQNNYEDQTKFFFPERGYFSWHLFPYEGVTKLFVEKDCVCIYLVRNLFDQSLSIYDHFRLNVDSEIGRGRNVDHLFENMDLNDGLDAIINGCDWDGFVWRGVAHQYKHMESIFDSALLTNSLVISYEDLCLDKALVINKIANHLGVAQPDTSRIVQDTSMVAMRSKKINKTHFNRGGIGRIFEKKYDYARDLLQIKTKRYKSFEKFEYLTELRALNALASE